MKLLIQLFQWLKQLFTKSRSNKKAGAKPVYYGVKHVHDFPDVLEQHTLYLQGKKGDEWLAGMSCPCGCNELIELVLKGAHPRWKVTNSGNGKPTITPSVFRNVGCRSHFFLTDGTIRWCD